MTVRQIRLNAGMTQDQLVEASGVSRSMLISIERGRASPTVRTLERLARAISERTFQPFENVLCALAVAVAQSKHESGRPAGGQ